MTDPAVPYVVADSEPLYTAVLTTFKKSKSNGSLLFTGRCPRCSHEFTTAVPLTAAIVTPGRAVTGQSAGLSLTAAPVEYTVYCSCLQEHEGRPDGSVGCGALTNITLTPKARR